MHSIALNLFLSFLESPYTKHSVLKLPCLAVRHASILNLLEVCTKIPVHRRAARKYILFSLLFFKDTFFECIAVLQPRRISFSLLSKIPINNLPHEY